MFKPFLYAVLLLSVTPSYAHGELALSLECDTEATVKFEPHFLFANEMHFSSKELTATVSYGREETTTYSGNLKLQYPNKIESLEDGIVFKLFQDDELNFFYVEETLFSPKEKGGMILVDDHSHKAPYIHNCRRR